jgi:hypothetical protein
MPIHLACACGKELNVREDLAGKKVRCPECQAVVPVPPADRPRPDREEEDRPARWRPELEDDDAEDESRWKYPARKPPSQQLVLRSSVLILAFLGSALAGVVGVKLYPLTHDPEHVASYERSRDTLREGEKINPKHPALYSFRQSVELHERLWKEAYCLLAACLLALAGGVLAMVRMGFTAAALLILPFVAASLIAWEGAVMTFPLLLPGGLALFIRSGRRRSRRKPRGELD